MSELGSGNGSSYPGGLDTDSILESSTTVVRSDVPNDSNAAIVAIETELGTDPAGSTANVKTYLQTEHNADGTHNIPTSSYNAGQMVQMVNVQDGAVATGTTTMPGDNSIPQITEGDEYMTLAITPTSTTNKLVVEVSVAWTSTAAADSVVTCALFQDSTADALSAISQSQTKVAHFNVSTFKYVMTAGTTSATTFRVRLGANNAGTTTFNGISGARTLGGVAASNIVIMEIKA